MAKKPARLKPVMHMAWGYMHRHGATCTAMGLHAGSCAVGLVCCFMLLLQSFFVLCAMKGRLHALLMFEWWCVCFPDDHECISGGMVALDGMAGGDRECRCLHGMTAPLDWCHMLRGRTKPNIRIDVILASQCHGC